MAKLTPRRRMLQKKLQALRLLGEHVGMWGTFRRPPTGYDPLLVLASLVRLMDEEALPEQRYACALILDFLLLEWREVVPAGILGPVVDRASREVAEWRKAVLARDQHHCVVCGSADRLHAHHIAPWADVPELRLVLENGITLCAECHGEMHPESAGFVKAADRTRGVACG